MLEKELSICLTATREAMKAIMEIYATPFTVETKEDESPVTLADKASNSIILKYLMEAFPEDGFLSEESQDDLSRLQKRRVWIIDPLDGTKEYVARNGEFAINIALSLDGRPILGIIAGPTINRIFYAIKGEGAFVIEADGSKRRIHASNRGKGELLCYCSRSHRNKDALLFVSNHKELFAGECIPMGSSLKMAYIAEGKADYFVRLYPGTKEWDVASGDLIVHEAGGAMVNGDGYQLFRYNKEDVGNHKGYVLSNSADHLFLEMVDPLRNDVL